MRNYRRNGGNQLTGEGKRAIKLLTNKVPKKLHIRWHDCPDCGCSLDRDHNAAINIKNRAEGHPVLKAQRLRNQSGYRSRRRCEALA